MEPEYKPRLEEGIYYNSTSGCLTLVNSYEIQDLSKEPTKGIRKLIPLEHTPFVLLNTSMLTEARAVISERGLSEIFSKHLAKITIQ